MQARRTLRPWRPGLLFVLLSVQAACMGDRVVFGNIPPSTFKFTTVIEENGLEPGGWQVAQVVVLLGRLSTMFPRAATCDVEVGMPLVNHLGYVSVEHARLESALSADRAARKLLKARERPTASICLLFRTTMEKYLRDPRFSNIPGAKVSRFSNQWVVPRETFPPRRGRYKK